MNQINKHIFNHVEQFINNDSMLFNKIFKELHVDIKYSYENLLKYFDNLINLEFSKNNDLNAFHIHFEAEFNESEKLLISEFFLIKSYFIYNANSFNLGNKDLDLQSIILELTNKYKSLDLSCPEGASGKNGGNRIWKNWIKEKAILKSLLNFYLKLSSDYIIKPNLLFNSQINFCRLVLDLFETRPFCISIDSKYKSYNVFNSNLTLNDIDTVNNEIIDNLKCIMLFDCERKKIMTNYSFEEFKKWNSDYGTNLKQYIIITFGKKNESINNIKNKIESIRNKFKIPENSSYTILKSELDVLLNKYSKNSPKFNFIGLNTSNNWDLFIMESSIRNLYELRSIKMMNIYSICYNLEIKEYILNEIFSNNESSGLISSYTKIAILELSDEDIELLKSTLSITLDYIINSELHKNIIDCNLKESILIFDETITKNDILVSKILKSLGLKKSKKIKNWTDFEIFNNQDFLFLSYRDQGKYPNIFFPNLFEVEFKDDQNAKIILPAFLFENHSNWAKYYLVKDYYKTLKHSIRENHFDWFNLNKSLESLRPESKLNIDWDLESEYAHSEYRESFKIKLKNCRSKTFNSSDLFILTNEQKHSFRVVKIDFLISSEDDDEIEFIQSLDEIQENINIYEKIVDKKREEAELDLIRKCFEISDERAGSLWKILLKNSAEKIGDNILYDQLKVYLESKGLRIVSFFHFKNSWINPESEIIAPLYKRIFIELCEFLKIPKAYFFIIQRMRNASKQSSRKSTRQMNQLLKDLFNDGCFDYGNNAREIINNKLPYYKSNHPLDELGIDEDYLADNLVTLTELIKPELQLIELETIERSI